jgi:aryl-alcohol dehydrogenase-like predicted oxidoreductase
LSQSNTACCALLTALLIVWTTDQPPQRTSETVGAIAEYSLIDREIEDDLLPTARELGVAIVAYGVLSRGMIQSQGKVQIKPNDFRAHLPRFSGENLERNNAIVQKLQDLAAEKNATATQVAFAWVISRGENIFPLVGAKSIEQLNECLASQTVKLNSNELAKLDSWFAPGAVAGTRYPEPMMAMLKG